MKNTSHVVVASRDRNHLHRFPSVLIKTAAPAVNNLLVALGVHEHERSLRVGHGHLVTHSNIRFVHPRTLLRRAFPMDLWRTGIVTGRTGISLCPANKVGANKKKQEQE